MIDGGKYEKRRSVGEEREGMERRIDGGKGESIKLLSYHEGERVGEVKGERTKEGSSQAKSRKEEGEEGGTEGVGGRERGNSTMKASVNVLAVGGEEPSRE